MSSLQAKADSAKAALVSTSICTPATVVMVKELLLPETETTSTASRTATTKRARANTNPKTKTNTAKSASNAAADQLSVKDRAALATHIINITIKSLTEAAKPASPATPSKRHPSQGDLRKASGPRTLRRSLSAPLSPVQPRSLNRTATSPNFGTKTATIQSLGQSTGCLATVECARAAFTCLRSIKGPVQAKQTDFQLENGMSAFVGKLLALGLQDQAIKELRILKRRLDAVIKDGAKPTKSTSTESQSTAQVIAELLDYDGDIPDQCLPIVTACQVQVLRLLAIAKKPAQIEAALPFLDESHASSPLNLLRKLATVSDKEGPKTARQLASVSQTLLSLAPSVSSKEDHAASEPRLSPSPSSAFRLQTLCFKAQLRWWKLAGHRGIVDEEVLSPLGRCIRAFTRRETLGDGKTYKIIVMAFNDILELVQSQSSKPSESFDSPLASIYQLLGATAHAERQYKEACNWFQKLKALSKPETDSFVRIYSISARFLASALKRPTLDTSIDQLIQEVVEGLDGSLSGSVSDLNELLESLSLARRSAVGFVASKAAEKGAGQSPFQPHNHLRAFLVRYPRFARRWLGAPPDKEASAKHHLQFDQRRQTLLQSISQVLDGALMVVNSELQSGSIAWQNMDEILQDCIKLLETVADPMFSAPRADPLGVYFVKMSSLYFSKFTQLRKDIGKSKDVNKQILQALSRSIEMVKDRSPALQEKAQLSIKLELFADLCKGAGHGNDAVKTLRSICTSMIEEGALLKVTAALSSQSPILAWAVDEKAETLSRTLRSIAKLDQSWNDWAFFLPEAERAAVLEHLMQVSSTTLSQSKPLKLYDPCAESLLRIYTQDRFPIRRLRVLLNLLFQNVGEEGEIEEIGALANETMEAIDSKSAEEDSALCRFVPHLQAYHASVSAMTVTDAPFPAQAMKDAVSSWSSIIEGCQVKDDLYEKIDSPESLVVHLQSASQFANLRGEHNLQLLILKLSASISKLLAEPTNNNIILNQTLLASQHLNIGHFAEAKKTLDLAKELLEQAEGASRGIVAGFHLSQAEYYTGIGSIDEAIVSLALAKEVYSGPTSSWALSKAQANVTLALAAFLDSTLALKQGQAQEALSCIKASVRALSHDWSKFEALQSREGTSNDPNTSTGSIDSVKTRGLGQLVGPRFWALAFPLLRGLLHISSVYAHLGMFQETIYYAESALKIAESTGSPLYKAQVLAWTGSIYYRAGRNEKALYYGNEAREQMPGDISASRVQLACQLGDLYRDIGDDEKAAEMLKLAEETTEQLGGKLAEAVEGNSKPATTTTKERATTTSRTTRTTRTTRTKPSAGPAPPPATRTRKRAPAGKSQPSPSTEVLKLPKDVYQASLMASVILSRALGFINQKDWASALSTLEHAKELPKLFGTLSQEQVVTAISLIGRSTEQMVHDPVFSVVQDSTISFPAISNCSDKGSGRLSISQTPPRKGRSAAASKERGVPAFADALRKAQELLLEAHASTLSTASSTMVHRISALLQSTVILLSATSASQSKVLSGSGFATFSVDLARNVTWRREQSTLQKEEGQTLVKSRSLTPIQNSRRTSLGLTTEMAEFQKNYVELVPCNWSIISASLSDNRHDLCITKFQAGHSPFILRLPLERANSRDADSEVFNFEHGREEMMDIIKHANETSHSANRDFSAKGARAAWWAEREALDSRLGDLLGMIETTWLGGFKGIFSQHKRRPDLLARFQKSFQQILDSSLPSRNRLRGKKTAKTLKVSLDPRILDLFIGLGDPAEPDCDFDEALNDLLYFVVDILQFHGEHNAYDEIDFDAMVVETYDALRGYYSATKNGAARMEDAHTVLVLDKALHAFPWESMPCMEGLAISRVPSLACLRQLILESQPAKAADGSELPGGHYVSGDRGTYILNPSTDLKNTQATFQPTLKNLPSWKGIVSRAPEEAEFEQALSDSEILLYFGHGSGAQYVRARTIRRLEKCKPATFLMGCSSASLTEAGEFECYGPVWNYMMAGCPAVVGALWDVTDRDIDRFTGRTLEEWGLVPNGTFGEGKHGKGKGKGKAVANEEEDGEVARDTSLVEAVARARQACRFKYLNAAAVVVYGIPVYINREDE